MSLRPRQDGRLGILSFVFELGEQDAVTARAGLPLVVETMRALGLEEVACQELTVAKRESEFPPEQKLESLVTLIAAGGDRVEDIRILGEGKGPDRLLGSPFPSPDALLDFLGQCHDPTCWATRPPEKKAYVPPESTGLVGLAAVNRALVARGADHTGRRRRPSTTTGPSPRRTGAMRWWPTRGRADTSRWWRCGRRSSGSWRMSVATGTWPGAKTRSRRPRGPSGPCRGG